MVETGLKGKNCQVREQRQIMWKKYQNTKNKNFRYIKLFDLCTIILYYSILYNIYKL